MTPEEDARLREIEQDAHLKPKVRLRAQVLRLSGRGEGVGSIAAYTGRSEASVLRDLARWEQCGFEGLADGAAPGNPSRVSAEVRAFVEERLSEERTWNASQLAEQIGVRFGVVVGAEAVRQHLLKMGYSWKRTRYVPAKPADPEEEREAREELEGLKGGLRGASWS
ncbi:MAG: helix-turn-helix domain-containing protein [Actinomycetota bacterium]|nr:helix-turn-helix domain-containing protein [Actinomycetota bacterium]